MGIISVVNSNDSDNFLSSFLWPLRLGYTLACELRVLARVAGVLYTHRFSLCSQPAVPYTHASSSRVDNPSASYSRIRTCPSSTCFVSCESASLSTRASRLFSEL